MSKRRKLEVVDSMHWPDSGVDGARLLPIDWDLYVLCQNNSDEPLICPTLAGYTTLVNNLTNFAQHNALPISVRLLEMDDGSGILSTLSNNHAKYHKICRNKYDSYKLTRWLSSVSTASDTAVGMSISRPTRSSHVTADIRNSCLFCDGGSTLTQPLVSACTKDIGPRIHAQAVEMQDSKLLAKMASTDFIALEVKYHKDCYTHFHNSCRSHQRAASSNDSDPHRLTYGSVLTELVQYMEEMFLYSDTAPVFRLSELTRLVANRMTNLGAPSDENSVNRTRLKDNLLTIIPGLREDKSGREVLLMFEPDVADAIMKHVNTMT